MATTDTDRRTAELRKKVEYQVACEERAHRIVERLIDNPVTQEQLINALHFITQGHYSDIVEERAVSKLCGYPLCPNSLADIPKQKYMISTKTNKVYDIESRKNFCSAKCYKASKHLESQVSNDPVWSRKNLRPTQFDILPQDMKNGRIGEEVIVSKVADIREDLGRLERLEKYEKNLAERIHDYNLEQLKLDDSEKSGDSKDTGPSDGGEEITIAHDPVVYTLDKAMNEMNIENHENSKAEGNHKQTEMSEVETVDTCSVEGKHSVIKGENEVMNKVGIHEISGTNEHKPVQLKQSKRKKVADPSKSKTDYLMQLLDKRKALLAKMADIRNDDSQKSETKVEQEKGSSRKGITGNAETTGTVDDSVEEKGQNKTEITEVKPVETDGLKTTEKTCVKSVVEIKKEKDLMRTGSVVGEKGSVSILDMIYSSVKSWITVKTVEYLKACEDDTGITAKVRTEFEKQYQELVAKVDAQVKDFDQLIGEESMEPDNTELPSAPLPHFDVLRQEMAADQARVSEFMKGSFTYKVMEKQPTANYNKDTPGVVLPTVDRYDQLMIRQKIVLERISKVLPGVLSPLHLLVQDVFTDFRKLICTFNLTSDNIVFKPGEWTVVTVILLRMLSIRSNMLQRSFTSPGAEKYFTVLLSGLGSSIDNVDMIVDNLMNNDRT